MSSLEIKFNIDEMLNSCSRFVSPHTDISFGQILGAGDQPLRTSKMIKAKRRLTYAIRKTEAEY